MEFEENPVTIGLDGFSAQGNEHDRGSLPGLFPNLTEDPPALAEPHGYPSHLPTIGDVGFVVLRDPDTCPSFMAADLNRYYLADPTLTTFDPCDVSSPTDDQGNLPPPTLPAPTELVSCETSCTSGLKMPCPVEYGANGANSEAATVRCPDETVVRFKLGTDGGAPALPGLVLLADLGRGRWVDVETDELFWKNLADWDSVSYVLDAAGRTSLMAHMNVVFGQFAPLVEFTDEGGVSRYQVDQGEECIAAGPDRNCPDYPPNLFASDDGQCDLTCLRSEFAGPVPDHCKPRDGDGGRVSACFDARMTCIYVPVFERVVTIRAFLVALNPFEPEVDDPAVAAHHTTIGSFEGAIHMIADDGDGLLEREDLTQGEPAYEVLAEATIRVQQAFGAACHRQAPPGFTDQGDAALPWVRRLGLFCDQDSADCWDREDGFCPPFVSSPIKTTTPRR